MDARLELGEAKPPRFAHVQQLEERAPDLRRVGREGADADAALRQPDAQGAGELLRDLPKNRLAEPGRRRQLGGDVAVVVLVAAPLLGVPRRLLHRRHLEPQPRGAPAEEGHEL
eukprot:808065-Heterocapsa_arctica.AAC.1